MDGAVVVEKPAGITSFGIVRRVRKLLGGEKVGHLGTLDPLGTGVLPLLIGKATRLAQFYGDHSRTYEATIQFGWATTTYDSEGDALGDPTTVSLDRSVVDEALGSFEGKTLQVPPPVSAKKVDGVRAYKLARRRQRVDLKPVEIEINELRILEIGTDTVQVRCHCSAGTYIRSLAHDVGQRLGCGAHIVALRRTQVGEFDVGQARTLDQLEALAADGRLQEAIRGPLELLPDMPSLRVAWEDAARIRHGQDFRIGPFGGAGESKFVKAVDFDGRILCIGQSVAPGMFHPIVVFQAAA